MEILTNIAIKIFLELIIISGSIGNCFSKIEERMMKTIEKEFSKRDKFFDAKFNIKKDEWEELLTSIKFHLIKSKK